MIHALANKIAVGIKRSAPDHPASVAVLAFSLAAVLNAGFIIALSLIISVFTNRFVETLTALLAFGLIRQISGGKHLKDGLLCIVVSVAGITALSFADCVQPIVLALNIISLALILIFAPSRIENQTRIPVRFYPLLKVLAALLVICNFIIGSSVLAATFFIQSLTLIRGRR